MAWHGMGWMKLPEPQPSEDSCHCSAVYRGPNAAARAPPVVGFLFSSFSFFSFFYPLLLPPFFLSPCATSRAAVPKQKGRERVISEPGWPTCRRHMAPPSQGKHRRAI